MSRPKLIIFSEGCVEADVLDLAQGGIAVTLNARVKASHTHTHPFTAARSHTWCACIQRVCTLAALTSD